jgi:hypothetical protein
MQELRNDGSQFTVLEIPGSKGLFWGNVYLIP